MVAANIQRQQSRIGGKGEKKGFVQRCLQVPLAWSAKNSRTRKGQRLRNSIPIPMPISSTSRFRASS
ncbi:unnamed protein product [Calypogeia fissa]